MFWGNSHKHTSSDILVSMSTSLTLLQTFMLLSQFTVCCYVLNLTAVLFVSSTTLHSLYQNSYYYSIAKKKINFLFYSKPLYHECLTQLPQLRSEILIDDNAREIIACWVWYMNKDLESYKANSGWQNLLKQNH